MIVNFPFTSCHSPGITSVLEERESSSESNQEGLRVDWMSDAGRKATGVLGQGFPNP